MHNKNINYKQEKYFINPTIVHSPYWLITIDLDGTLLKTPSKEDLLKNIPNYDINPLNIKVLKKLIDKGHKVAIVTGRPWRDTEEVYKKIGLRTVVANYNGASIHNPNDEGFLPYTSAMNRKYFDGLLNRTSIKKYFKNFVVECYDTTYILDATDKELLNKFHIHYGPKVIEISKDFALPINPQSLIFKLEPKKDFNKSALLIELKRKYGETFLFRYWDALDGKDFVYLEVNTKSITKGSALQFISSYYNIPISNTIAFGDGENDLEMLEAAAVGVAMRNASEVVKSHAKDVTNLTNDEGGVGDYLESFFKLK
ncbi:Cof-type HAD-IIB family hydrolase [Candidatus Hepatoplasma crinochetorum]|uniref:Putative phosphatase YwpJ n=1 Tax=Candidatus Hepatoplasma crinochetorum Av TaxID=1427984 RepID=W8GF34_9MOLU|nr:Cof-type HAD-IIB family hydrolase [Candidatus Hepatoplasma crinochetorum]AHK22374.1 putative phosphatase YwpJ [Candidatus Hepatoplasma crinochetorum Av]BDV02962.1 MAG: hypothetical protein HCTKY_2560 [Candidatus Hepatoplasma crinochetorum]